MRERRVLPIFLIMLLLRPASSCPTIHHTTTTSLAFHRIFARPFLKCLSSPSLSIRNHADPQPDPDAPPSPSDRPFFRARALSAIRTVFVDAVAAIAASRLTNGVQRIQEFELPLQTDESPLPYTTVDDDEIVAVREDNVESSVLWEQRKKDVEAEKARSTLTSPGFSFSPAGLLFPYHLGAAQCLIEHGYITENTPLSGSSAGALVCAVIASGLSMHDAMLATKELASDCRVNGTAFRLGAVLRGFLERFLPDDAHIRSRGRIRVAITQVFRTPRALLVDQFDSKEDLIDALHTSCFIPGYFAPRPVAIYKNCICIDGGFTLFMPPTSADITVRICAFPATRLGLKGIGICPDSNSKIGRTTPRQLLNWAIEPADDELLEDFFNVGYQDALIWVDQCNSSEVNEFIASSDAESPSSSHI